jgi:hypothetical protein
MAFPAIPQGVIIRVKGSLTFAQFPGLNITASYLGKEAIRFTRNNKATDQIGTLTGAVQSPAPYQQIALHVALLRTQPLAWAFKTQMEQNITLLGDCTLRTDSVNEPPYQFVNTAIEDVGEISIAGENPAWGLMLTAYLNVNLAIWN